MRCWDWFGDRSLVVVDIGLACCAVEFEVAATDRPVVELRPDDRVAVVVSGTVTDALLPVVQGILGQVPNAQVVSFGACASSGGPYWDSYAVTKGISQVVTVDNFVPGCPPPPSALDTVLTGLRKVKVDG